MRKALSVILTLTIVLSLVGVLGVSAMAEGEDAVTIILTGGIAKSDYFTGMVKDRISFLAPVSVYGGENEMESLAFGALRVLRGEEKAQEFTKVEGRL